MPTLAFVLSAAGVILILVGAVGGGFSLSTIEFPKVGFVPRVISFVAGSALVVFGIGVFALELPPTVLTPPAAPAGPAAPADPPLAAPADSQPAPAPPNSNIGPNGGFLAPIMATPGYSVFLFDGPSLSAPYASDAPDGLSDSQVVEIICTTQGDPVTFAGNTSALWNGVYVGNGVIGFIPDVHLATGTWGPTMPDCST